MKVYYWEGSIWKNRELQSQALLVRVQQTACVTPPNFIMGSPLIDFHSEAGPSERVTQLGLVRVIDEAAFDLKVFGEILVEVFGGDARLKLLYHEHDQTTRVALPASSFSFFKSDQPDWEGEFEKWTQK